MAERSTLNWRYAVACCAIVVGLPVGTLFAAQPEKLSFNRDVRPILSDRCYACHGPDSANRAADLRLDTYDGATEWSVIPGEADSSEVILRVESDDPDYMMPPASAKKPPLTKKEIETLKRWINEGAEYEPHWAYLPVERSQPPEVKTENWVRSPIDQFVLARMEAEGLEPSPEADRHTLIRRLYFDLVGMPPSRSEVEAFVNDESDDAYEKLVERLLASPHYGERMATWWFDLVRFANTVGYHGDQDHAAVPYRDYVIKSLNDNLPFDQFTIDQLAGDLVPNPTMWQRVATGYNRILQTSHEGGIQDKEYLAIHLADRVRNLGEVWLAASTGCAQCHDHKFDPITQKDFFSLGAFFADVDHHGSFAPVSRNSIPTQRAPEIKAWTLPLYERITEIDREIARLQGDLAKISTSNDSTAPDRLKELKKERKRLEKKFVPAMVTEAREPRVVRVLDRGNWMDETGEIVEPAVLHFLEQIDTGGRRANRLDLAKWLVSGKNPLVGRVVANRLWDLFYGRGISPTLIDMGSQSDWPSHPELLDWLADEFVHSGWNVKHMVRLMVTSSTYRQSSLVSEELEELDPKNVLLARQGRFRLDAEMIRDQALSVSGLLSPMVGGESGRPYQPKGYYAQLNFPEREYKPADDEYQYRRGVYTHWQRQFLHPWLLAFDAPAREECTAQRAVSNTPGAALVLLNDPSFVEAAKVLAERVLTEGPKGDDRERSEWLWSEVTSRPAKAAEIDLLVALLEKQRATFEANPQAAEKLLAVGLHPRAEELPATEQAAWTAVCRVVLNLDETITRH